MHASVTRKPDARRLTAVPPANCRFTGPPHTTGRGIAFFAAVVALTRDHTALSVCGGRFPQNRPRAALGVRRCSRRFDASARSGVSGAARAGGLPLRGSRFAASASLRSPQAAGASLRAHGIASLASATGGPASRTRLRFARLGLGGCASRNRRRFARLAWQRRLRCAGIGFASLASGLGGPAPRTPASLRSPRAGGFASRHRHRFARLRLGGRPLRAHRHASLAWRGASVHPLSDSAVLGAQDAAGQRGGRARSATWRKSTASSASTARRPSAGRSREGATAFGPAAAIAAAPATSSGARCGRLQAGARSTGLRKWSAQGTPAPHPRRRGGWVPTPATRRARGGRSGCDRSVTVDCASALS